MIPVEVLKTELNQHELLIPIEYSEHLGPLETRKFELEGQATLVKLATVETQDGDAVRVWICQSKDSPKSEPKAKSFQRRQRDRLKQRKGRSRKGEISVPGLTVMLTAFCVLYMATPPPNTPPRIQYNHFVVRLDHHTGVPTRARTSEATESVATRRDVAIAFNS